MSTPHNVAQNVSGQPDTAKYERNEDNVPRTPTPFGTLACAFVIPRLRDFFEGIFIHFWGLAHFLSYGHQWASSSVGWAVGANCFLMWPVMQETIMAMMVSGTPSKYLLCGRMSHGSLT